MANYQTAVENSLTTFTHSVIVLFHCNRIFSIHHYIKTVPHYVILIDRRRERKAVELRKKERSVYAEGGNPPMN